MAHVVTLKDAFPAVVATDIPEGRFVTMAASGERWELPTAVLAASGQTRGVFMLFVLPDQFPRPTREGWYTARDTQVIDVRTGHKSVYKTHDVENMWLIGPSVLPTTTALSGWRVGLHRGGTYLLQSGEYRSSAGIKVNGAGVKIGASGVIEHDASNANRIGFVREWNADENTLIITLEV